MAHLRFSDPSGASLIELLVGSAIAVIVLGAVVGLQIRAYRYQAADESGYVLQTEAANALERIVKEIRSSSGATVSGAGCEMALTIHLPGGPVSYTRTPEGRVIRTAASGETRTVGMRTACLTFADRGGAVTVEWTAAPEGGRPFTLRTTAAPRVRSAPDQE